MAKIERFEDIEAWKAARELANFVYDLTDKGQFAITNDELAAGIHLAEKTSRLTAGFIAYLESVTG